MNTRSIFLAMVLTLAAAGHAQANCGKCGMEDSPKDDMSVMVSEKVQKLTRELSLTDEQKGKVEGIVKEKFEKKHQIMEEKRKAMDTLDDDFVTTLKGVLTEEQAQKWEASKKDGHGAMGKCSKCKDGKVCKKCLIKKNKKDHERMDGKCTKCKDGKMCKKCMRKKTREGHEEDHE